MQIGGSVNQQAGGDAVIAEGNVTMQATADKAEAMQAQLEHLTTSLQSHLLSEQPQADTALGLLREIAQLAPKVGRLLWQTWQSPLTTLGLVWGEAAPHPDKTQKAPRTD